MERVGLRGARPTKASELVDLSSKFGVSFGSESDSSDAEFVPGADSEGVQDSDDEDESSEQEGFEDSEKMETEQTDETTKNSNEEYNPLIVRRSQRAIKPTKDIDLYLLGAQFGVNLEESDADSSDMEFAPTKDSDDVESLSGSSSANNVSAESTTGGTASGEDTVTTQSDEVPKIRSDHHQDTVATKMFDIPLCSVCLEDSNDDIVECDCCGISVHEGCYGVPEDDGVDDSRSDLSSFTTIPWFCDACKAGVKTVNCSCMLCPTIGGLFKQTINGRWVHVVCGLYTPGIEYVEPSQLGGVTFDQIPAAKWGSKVCQLCENERYSRTGVCIGCDAGMCKSVFHVTCAQRHGLLCEVENDEKENELCDPYFAQCKQHSLKEVIKRKRRDYLTVINKQKMFVFDSNDERIQHYLKEARDEYGKYFRGMQDYYKAELRRTREERYLHHIPNAVRRLTQKAQLLGYTDEIGDFPVDTRKKIAPGLTNEFVNYFNERQGKVKSTDEQLEGLKEASQRLKVEEKQVKEELGWFERELSVARSKVTAAQSQVDGLYLIMSRIANNENIKVPAHLKAQQEPVKEDEKEKPSCDVCNGSHDSHLLALCDTCNRHYHIGCLDPPLSKVPKKTAKWGWQCHKCGVESGDELLPTIASFDEPSSRSGRKIQAPKQLTYPDNQVKPQKRSKYKSRAKK